jgi:hypothetical protein
MALHAGHPAVTPHAVRALASLACSDRHADFVLLAGMLFPHRVAMMGLLAGAGVESAQALQLLALARLYDVWWATGMVVYFSLTPACTPASSASPCDIKEVLFLAELLFSSPSADLAARMLVWLARAPVWTVEAATSIVAAVREQACTPGGGNGTMEGTEGNRARDGEQGEERGEEGEEKLEGGKRARDSDDSDQDGGAGRGPKTAHV